MLVRGVTVGPLVTRLGEAAVTRMGGVILATGLAVGAFANSWPMLAVALTCIAGGTGTLFPPLAALISRSTAPEAQGSTLGINQFFGGVARVVGPLWGAAAFDASGASAPFLTASLGVGVAFLLMLRLRQPEPIIARAASSSVAAGDSDAAT